MRYFVVRKKGSGVEVGRVSREVEQPVGRVEASLGEDVDRGVPPMGNTSPAPSQSEDVMIGG